MESVYLDGTTLERLRVLDQRYNERAYAFVLAALEDLTDERMRLEVLQQVVDGELDVAVVEPHDHPDRHHVLPHRIDERAAELAIARLRP